MSCEHDRALISMAQIQLGHTIATPGVHACRYLETHDAAGKRVRQPLPVKLARDPAASFTLGDALTLLRSSDLVLGQHPDTQLNIVYKVGRFGPYYEHGSLRFSAGATAQRVAAGAPKEGEESWQPSLEHAIARLDMKAKKYGARAPLRRAAAALAWRLRRVSCYDIVACDVLTAQAVACCFC